MQRGHPILLKTQNFPYSINKQNSPSITMKYVYPDNLQKWFKVALLPSGVWGDFPIFFLPFLIQYKFLHHSASQKHKWFLRINKIKAYFSRSSYTHIAMSLSKFSKAFFLSCSWACATRTFLCGQGSSGTRLTTCNGYNFLVCEFPTVRFIIISLNVLKSTIFVCIQSAAVNTCLSSLDLHSSSFNFCMTSSMLLRGN